MGDRWSELFADLEAEADAADAVELDEEVRDRGRREVALVHLADRVAAATHELAVTVRGAGTLRGTVSDAAPDWLLLGTPREVLVPLAAVLHVGGLTAVAEQPRHVRLGLGYALRALARRRSVAVTLVDGTALTGRIDRVGADFVDLAQDGSWRTIPFAALATVREADV